MTKVEISIVVPVFNVEGYLNRCVKSLVEQCYEQFEIILVDDGSKDKSGQICDEWKEKDSRIRVIHKKNGGLSSARNTGIQYARGKYICFIDSDDWIEKDYLLLLRNTIISTDADFVQCCYKKVNDHKILFDKSNNDKNILYFNSKEAITSALLNEKITWSAWGKLYKKSCFDGIEYPEGKIFEDKPVTTKIILNSITICYIEISLYNYYFNEKSISNNKFSLKKLDAIEMGIKSSQMIKEAYPDLEKLCLSHLFFLYLYIFTDTYGQPEFEKLNNKAFLKMMSYWKYVVFNTKTSIQGKVKAIMVLSGKDKYFRFLKGIQR